ncbi:hypothetical protein HN358_03880 [Candidatus Uhrbacteria bacterium]|nr:hypothetical protein [Candidatus Uhrbacteria bacterium]
MSEKLRNRLTSYLGTTVIFMMVFGVMWQAMPVPVAHAADTISSAVYIDSNKDGAVDNIKLTFDANMTQCDYEAGDWTVNTASEMTVVITGINGADPEGDGNGVCDGTDAVVYLSVTADAGETGAATDPVVSYTNQGVMDELKDSGNISSKASQTVSDGAIPRIKSAQYGDADFDGKIDVITLAFTETVTAASILAPDNISISNVGDFTSAAIGTDTTDLITGSVSTLVIDLLTLGTEASVVDTYESSGNIEISTADATGNFTLTDGTNENSDIGAKTNVTFLDGAKPVVTSATPTDASSVQSRTNAVVYNFSEPMAADTWVHSTDFVSTPDPGGWSGAMSLSDTSITLTHAPFLCIQAYSIALTEASIAAQNGESGFTALTDTSAAPIGVAHTFTTMSCGTASTSAAEDTETTYEIDVLTPNGGETLAEGEEYEITWEASPEGMYYIDLYYLGADGEYVEIATVETNDGSYDWTVPADVEDSMIKVVWTDLAEELGSDTSDADFNDTDTDTTSDDDTADDTAADDTTDEAVAPSGTGISPVTGEEEEITAVEPGDYITSPSFSTVYYVTEDFERRAFISSAVFFTYADSYDEIMDVTDATLTELELGSNMLPNPGVVLVKVQSDAKTYAVDSNYDLRWITSEEIAIELYGDDWADYIIDVEATFFASFGAGDDVDSSDDITLVDMKTREEVSQ